MRVGRRFNRQFNSLHPSLLVKRAVSLGRAFAAACDRWLDDGQLLPPAVARGAMRGLVVYLAICVVIWTAVYFHNHLDIFWVNQ